MRHERRRRDSSASRHRLAAAAAGAGAARRLHALAGAGDALAQLLLDAEEGAAGGLRRPRQLPRDGRGRRCSGRRSQQRRVFALGTIPLSIALAIAMALWVNARLAGRGFLRLAYFTPTVLPMIAVANIWLFFYTPQYGLLEQITQALGLPSHNWLGDSRDRARRADRRRDLEGGRLLHDLLPRRAAADLADAGRGGGARGRVALRSTSAACSSRC